ncbi:MAG TPA: response regulator transcription factor [Methylomirabilota bacterium]|nr:response regulator transcription factor [Methylomirabilota bacterium]
MITAIYIEPHVLIRKATMRLLLDHTQIQFVADVGDGAEGIAAFYKHMPDLVITEAALPNARGVEVLRTVREAKGHALVLSSQADDTYVTETLRAGALGYVLKQDEPATLLAGIAAVARGESFLSARLKACALRAVVHKDLTRGIPWDNLTAREREVVRLAAEGKSASQIASVLFISRRTAETHRANLMRKIGAKSQTELVRFAVRHGIVAP